MTCIAKESGRLAWLAAALAEQRDIVASLLRRLTYYSPSGSMKPSIFRKFMGTLEQISLEKERETEILSRIQAIEARHRFQRSCKTLRHASSDVEPHKSKIREMACAPERTSSNNDWLLIVGLVCLMSRRGPKPQE